MIIHGWWNASCAAEGCAQHIGGENFAALIEAGVRQGWTFVYTEHTGTPRWAWEGWCGEHRAQAPHVERPAPLMVGVTRLRHQIGRLTTGYIDLEEAIR